MLEADHVTFTEDAVVGATVPFLQAVSGAVTGMCLVPGLSTALLGAFEPPSC